MQTLGLPEVSNDLVKMKLSEKVEKTQDLVQAEAICISSIYPSRTVVYRN